MWWIPITHRGEIIQHRSLTCKTLCHSPQSQLSSRSSFPNISFWTSFLPTFPPSPLPPGRLPCSSKPRLVVWKLARMPCLWRLHLEKSRLLFKPGINVSQLFGIAFPSCPRNCSSTSLWDQTSTLFPLRTWTSLCYDSSVDDIQLICLFSTQLGGDLIIS